MPNTSITNLPITKVNGDTTVGVSDALAIEEPLEIRLEFGPAERRSVQNISVTMRTPGNDVELALGFLFTEGIIQNFTDIADVAHTFIACAENKENVIQVSLNETAIPNLRNAERNFYTTSSCGVCGKGSIDAIRTVSTYTKQDDINIIDSNIFHQLPQKLSHSQQVFADTGGLHASALFTPQGELLLLREDVGRHNALDKLIGAVFKGVHQKYVANISPLERGRADESAGRGVLTKRKEKSHLTLPLTNYILLLSGRASFELIQKAAMAGITVVAAVGAPSSLAVQLAAEFNITLVGFLRNNRFNIYTMPHRILIPDYETTH